MIDLAVLPKAELHLHLEGSISPAAVVALAARHGEPLTEAEVLARYRAPGFAAFIDAYKWVTSLLREPQDYALIAAALCENLLAERVIYAEVTISAGVMLLRKQDPAANFRAIVEAAAPFAGRGLRLQWIFDAVRQFGATPAQEVARCAADLRSAGVVAFGIGGDELAVPASEFRAVFDFAAAHGLRRVAHAGEIGGPQSVRDAVEQLGAERIGHGIAAALDPALMAWLAERAIPLEICPVSNLRTGALARLLVASSSHAATSSSAPDASTVATLAQHPLPLLLRAGIPVALSTDDPAMFETSLSAEYSSLSSDMGLAPAEILRVAETSFTSAFLPPDEAASYLAALREPSRLRQ